MKARAVTAGVCILLIIGLASANWFGDILNLFGFNSLNEKEIITDVSAQALPAFNDTFQYESIDGKVVKYSNGQEVSRIVGGNNWFYRCDNELRPKSEYDINTGSWEYHVEDLGTQYKLSTEKGSITIPKKTWLTWNFNHDRISFDFQATKSQLIARSTAYNSTCRYIKIGNANSWKKIGKALWNGDFNWRGDIKIRDSGTLVNVTDPEFNETYEILNYNYFNNSKASFHVVGEKLYWLICDLQYFQTGVEPFYFSSESYHINGTAGADFGWENMTFSGTVEVKGTGNLELTQKVDDYVAYWRFDENTGSTAYDQTGVNNGTLTNMEAEDWVSGKYGRGLYFDGVNEYVLTTYYPDPRNATTLSYWVNWHTFEENELTGCRTIEGDRFYLGSDIGGYTFFGVGDTYHDEAHAISHDMSENNWYHVAMTINGSMARYYVDGIEKDSFSYSAGGAITNGFAVATQYPLTGWESKATKDDVRIYNRVLSLSEINQTRDNEHNESGNATLTDACSGSNVIKWFIPTHTNTSQNNISVYINETLKCSACVSGTNYSTSDEGDTIRLYFQTGNLSTTTAVSDVEFGCGAATVAGKHWINKFNRKTGFPSFN